MSNELMISNLLNGGGQLPSALAGRANANDELGGGIGQSFGVITYRGKVWRIKYQGNERIIGRDDDPNEPRSSIDVVIIKAAAHISKIWYEGGYKEGSNERPDCWSANGQVPDAASPKKQHPTCGACPKNVFGSRITENGKQGKECVDYKRLVVAPISDIENEAFGGPMMLRVPAASLKEIKLYADQLKGLNFPYFAVHTRIGFDPEVAYPKLTFRAMRPLNETEATTVVKLLDDDRVKRIIDAPVEAATHEPIKEDAPTVQTASSFFGQSPVPPTTTDSAPAPAAPKVLKAAPPAPKPRQTAVGYLETGEKVEYDVETEEVIRVLEPAPAPEKPKVLKKAAAAPAATPAPEATGEEKVAAVAPEQFNAMLDGLLASE